MMVLSATFMRSEAAEWSAQPSLSVRGQYNSNLLLTSSPHEGVWGVWASPGMKFAGSTENFEMSGRTAADFVNYYGGENRSLTNLYFPISAKYTTQRETFGFDGGFIRDNTLMGELRQTGVAINFTQRNMWNLSPSWTHALTEQVSLQAGFQYVNTTYENGLQLGLVDYDLQGGSGAVIYSPGERDEFKLSFSYTDFHAPQANSLRSEIYNVQPSWTHGFSESISATIAGGPSLVHSAVGAEPFRQSDRQTVWVGSANLKKQWEDASAQVEIGRDINPSGFGLLLKTDRLTMTLSKNVNERWTASLSGAYVMSSGLSTQTFRGSFPDNQYITVSPAVNWKIGEWWAVDFTYTYSDRQVKTFNDHATANIGSIMLTYFPPKLRMGR
ncbi:conserved exported protein of unknown function [Nitrospira sp. KM1]|nr:conserved exported protein of unknown function [Nitrospira sp. KM1]